MLVCLAFVGVLIAQPTSDGPLAQPANGVRQSDPTWHVLVGATVHVRPGEVVEGASIEMRDGRIVRVGAGLEPPAGARVWDMAGRHVYAGLIDAYVEVDVPALAAGPGRHWNPLVTPERSVLTGGGLGAGRATSLRESGFVAAGVVPGSGIFRGQTAVVSLGKAADDASQAGPPVYRERVFHAVAFETARGGAYPASGMGALALIRQTVSDADWQRGERAAGRLGEPMNCLDALSAPDLPLLVRSQDEMETLAAGGLARELGRPVVVLGSGLEFRWLDAVVADGLAFVLPVDFPEAPQVATVGQADAVDLKTLMTWEQAPTNPRRLDDAGLSVSLTTHGLKRTDLFHTRLRYAMRHGLEADRALAMLTTTPAQLLGVEQHLGTIEAGKAASLVVCDGLLFDDATTIRDVWVDGRRYEIHAETEGDFDGEWQLSIGDLEMQLTIEGKKITAREGDAEGEARAVSIDHDRLHFIIDDEDDGTGSYLMQGVLEGDRMTGVGMNVAGDAFQWTARRLRGAEQPDAGVAEGIDARDEAGPIEVPETIRYPFGAYAVESLPPSRAMLITGATIWTSGDAGIIENGALLTSAEGKILYVGPADGVRDSGIPLPGDLVEVDATGKHITPGIIDCHSHTGLSSFGINESGQAVTAEVRISDSLNTSSVNFYRQLAGGVTTVNSLHGSANPIGGQNLVHRLRWGVPHPRDAWFDGAPQGIKFALGENVKQANWGDHATTRYPQTRMGVETLMRDRFIAARAYAQRWSDYAIEKERVELLQRIRRALTPEERAEVERFNERPAPRRDLELEAIAQILAGDRLVHCHSYRQDEILMLCRVAEEFGFTIGTFQHVLEGYKVAEEIAQHALGASAFSDWWAYKVEVQDAIPFNGALMHEVGVVVSFNSDSDELARRLNLEAAKAVRYGGLAPSEALKFVTLNPAIQLGIADRVGSLEAGKDADFAVWSGDPLSSFSRCEATYILAAEHFSLDRDREHRARIAQERSRLIHRILDEAHPRPGRIDNDRPEAEDRPGDEAGAPEQAGDGADGPVDPEERARLENIRRHYLLMLESGEDLSTWHCGDCGETFQELSAGHHDHHGHAHD
ncbi:MAG: amidohydrolase family protein [Phycisphaerales bacterium JB063]